MKKYDIIGDIHGCAEQLEALLIKMDYDCIGSTYQHPERTAVFLGDFIDRGPEQARTLNIVRYVWLLRRKIVMFVNIIKRTWINTRLS